MGLEHCCTRLGPADYSIFNTRLNGLNNLSLRQCLWLSCSVTRWLDYVSIFDHLQQRKLTQKCKKCAKVGSTFCQKRNKRSEFCQMLVKFCQSGKISPNLATLIFCLLLSFLSQSNLAENNGRGNFATRGQKS